MPPLLSDLWQRHAILQGSRNQRVAHQADDGHGANTARHWRDRAGHFRRFVISDIADDLVFAVARIDAIDADIDHGRAGLHPIGFHKLGFADGGDENVGAARNGGKIARARVRHRHRRILGEQQLRRGLSEQQRTADHQRVRSGDIAGKDVLVIGRSLLFGKPAAQLLLAANATVTMAHSRSRDLPKLCAQADLVYAAVGKAERVRADWIKPGATVIDVGITRRPTAEGKTKLVGDVAFAEVSQVAGAITPVPGGVGQMTVACLLVNTLRAACAIAGVAKPAV